MPVRLLRRLMRIILRPSPGGEPLRQAPGEAAAQGPPGLKHPWLAILFSILFSGLGQLYNGQILKGLLFLAVQVVNFALIHWFIGLLTAPAFWLYALFDALDTTERINAGRIKRYVDARYGGSEPAEGGGESPSPENPPPHPD